MDQPNPNEVIHTWNNEGSLVDDLLIPSDVRKRAVDGSLERLDSAPVETRFLSLRDGNGEPLKFPLRLVSATEIPGREQAFDFQASGPSADLPANDPEPLGESDYVI